MWGLDEPRDPSRAPASPPVGRVQQGPASSWGWGENADSAVRTGFRRRPELDCGLVPRSVPHFKILTSIMNHPKTTAMWGNNELLSMYVRLGVLAIERFADRSDNSFFVHDRELALITGKGRADVARKSLRYLADISPISVEHQGDVWLITFPNLAERQGFKRKNGKLRAPPSTSTSTSTSKKRKERAKRAPRTSCPEHLQPEQRERIRAWASRQPTPIAPELLEPAWEKFSTWAEADDHQRRDWEAAFRNALGKGWCLADLGAVAGESNAQARQRRTRQAGVEAVALLRRREAEKQQFLSITGGKP